MLAFRTVTYCTENEETPSRMMDEILRRSQWLQSKDLHGQRSVDELKARCTVLYESQAALFECV